MIYFKNLSRFRLIFLTLALAMCLLGCALYWLPQTTHYAPLTSIQVAIKNQLPPTPLAGRVLSGTDRVLYAQAFEAQSFGNWADANQALAKVRDPILKGHVLYERYMAPDYKSTYTELYAWLENYDDHPNALKIYDLANKRRAEAKQAPKKPASKPSAWTRLKHGLITTDNHANEGFGALHLQAEQQKLANNIYGALRQNEPTRALHLLETNNYSSELPKLAYDQLLGDIAASYFYAHKPDKAWHVASRATQRSGTKVPRAAWVAGLASWQLQHYGTAFNSFKLVANSQTPNPWLKSAGAFWAARAAEKIKNHGQKLAYLKQAASQPRTFYGLLAAQQLGLTKNVFAWQHQNFDHDAQSALVQFTAGRRALALIDIEQNKLAETELQQITPNHSNRVAEALLAAVNEFKMPQLALKLANSLQRPQGGIYDAALYPVLPWQTAHATTNSIDQALTHALIRQESRFNPNARNVRSGAAGLMQLMPQTARYMSQSVALSQDALLDPDINIQLGQRYMGYLLNMPIVQNNLFYGLIAYNAGPGNLQRWQKNINTTDPLMFIESVPFGETRAYAERVLTNFWIYRLRLNQPTPCLKQVLNGQWPSYVPADVAADTGI